MKAFDLITALDEAKNGHVVAKTPSHAPTSGTDPTTKGKGHSEDHGQAVKKAKAFAGSAGKGKVVAATPSHAPTSGADPTTTGKGHSEDEGETVKKAIKDSVDAFLNDELDAEAFLAEGAHKPGCQCGFCKNKGSFSKNKKKDDESATDSDSTDKEDNNDDDESIAECDMPSPARNKKKKQAGIGKPAAGVNPKKAIKEADMATAAPKRRIGDTDRFQWRQRISPRSSPNAIGKAVMAQEAASDSPTQTIEQIADQLLKSPESE